MKKWIPVLLLSGAMVPGYSQSLSPLGSKTYYNEPAKTWYTVDHNATAIQVRLAIVDSAQQRKILNNGLDLWVDLRGKKHKTTGITYPLSAQESFGPPPGGGQRGRRPGGGEEGGGPPQGDRPQNGERPERGMRRDSGDRPPMMAPSIQQLIDQKNELEIVGFKKGLNGRHRLPDRSGIAVSLHYINDTLYYDALIPFSAFDPGAKTGRRISIGIVENGTGEKTSNSGDQGMMGGGPPMGGGGPPMGGGGGGRGGGGMMPGGGGMFPPMSQDEQQSIDNVIWMKFKK